MAMLQQNQMIMVKPELLEILNSFGQSHAGGKAPKKSARGLAGLKVNSMKSKKRSYEEFK